MTITASITAVFKAISDIFKSITQAKKQQSETDVIKTKKKNTKAIDIAERLIFYVDRNFDVEKDKDYQKLRKKFFKYNQ